MCQRTCFVPFDVTNPGTIDNAEGKDPEIAPGKSGSQSKHETWIRAVWGGDNGWFEGWRTVTHVRVLGIDAGGQCLAIRNIVVEEGPISVEDVAMDDPEAGFGRDLVPNSRRALCGSDGRCVPSAHVMRYGRRGRVSREVGSESLLRVSSTSRWVVGVSERKFSFAPLPASPLFALSTDGTKSN